MRSVVRGKIWGGSCGFGTEGQRTNGKKENTLLTDSCEHKPHECFGEGRFLSHVRIYSYTTSELQHREDL